MNTPMRRNALDDIHELFLDLTHDCKETWLKATDFVRKQFDDIGIARDNVDRSDCGDGVLCRREAVHERYCHSGTRAARNRSFVVAR